MNKKIDWNNEERELVFEQTLELLGKKFTGSGCEVARKVDEAQKIILEKSRHRNLNPDGGLACLGKFGDRFRNHTGITLVNPMAGHKMNGAKKVTTFKAPVVKAPLRVKPVTRAVKVDQPQPDLKSFSDVFGQVLGMLETAMSNSIRAKLPEMMAEALSIVRSQELGGAANQPEFVSAANNSGKGLVASKPSKRFTRPNAVFFQASESEKKRIMKEEVLPIFVEALPELRKTVLAQGKCSGVVFSGEDTRLAKRVLKAAGNKKTFMVPNKPGAMANIANTLVAQRKQ